MEKETVVQKFITAETKELLYDNEKLDEWNEYVNSLDLTGQKKIVTKDKSPIPFLYMKSSIKEIFQVLCPIRDNVKNYDKTPIPLGVLDLIALSNKEDYFSTIQIWYDDKSPDPIAVGVIQSWRADGAKRDDGTDDNTKFSSEKLCNNYIKANSYSTKPYHYSWEDTYYLLARWGDESKTLKELKDEAIEKYKADMKFKLEQDIIVIKRQLDDLNYEINKKFN